MAVDPSSPTSGGALLGDRIRVRAAAADPGVFLRSMAARDRLGGLSEATRAAVVILGAAFDRVFVETVGVGQSEVEVAALVDTLVYVANPGTGDWLQFMKAGRARAARRLRRQQGRSRRGRAHAPRASSRAAWASASAQPTRAGSRR